MPLLPLLLLLILSVRLPASVSPESAAQKAYLANINAVMIFTSKEGLNSGTYEFTRANATMNIFHLPFRYNLEFPGGSVGYFLLGSVGYSETTMTSDLNSSTTVQTGIELTTTNMMRTYTGGVGGGVRYCAVPGIEVRGGVELIYSRVGITNRDATGAGDAVENLFQGQYNDNLSYRFFLKTEFRGEYAGFQPYAKLGYELYETKSAITFRELSRFTTQSGVISFALGSETPPLLHHGIMYLTLEGYLQGSYLSGDITRVSGFDGYGTVGGIAYWYVPETPAYIRRFYLELSTIQADGLRGYNVGLGFSLAY